MKHQLDATQCRFYFCSVTLHVSGASAHHQEYLKLVQRPLVHVLSLQVSRHITLLEEIKPAQRCIKLVFYLTYTMMHGNTKLKFCERSYISYVYWTVHYLDSWIKINQLDVTCFFISLFTAQHVSNVSTSIFRSLRLIGDLFHGLYCSVRLEVLALASLFSGEWLVVTCVVVLISVSL